MIVLASALIVRAALAQPEGRVEAFPGVVVDYGAGTVELAGFIPVDAHQEKTPDVMIELIAEAHGVRDFEALVRVHAEARHAHAALLLLGLEPGSPGFIEAAGPDEPLRRVAPTGPEVTIRVRSESDGQTIEEDPCEWVRNSETGRLFSELDPRFYFGGSSEREFAGEMWYMARAEGTLVGLCTFGTHRGGTETIGCTPVLSPHSDAGDPVWLAVSERMPKFGTPVTLVIRPVEVEPEKSPEDE